MTPAAVSSSEPLDGTGTEPGRPARRSAGYRRRAGDLLAAANARVQLRAADLGGPRVRLRGRARVIARGELSIADRVQLVGTLAPLELVAETGARLQIGERTLVNFGTQLVALERVTIGPRCLIGTHCLVTDSDFHDIDPDRRLEPPTARPVTIGENVWLCARVIVLPGVTIGDHSVVGAGSVVTRDVPPRTLAAGAPARVIRQL